MGNSLRAKQCWRIAFVVYAAACLSSMAGMSIGLGIFAAASLWYFAASWNGEGRAVLRQAFASPYTSASVALFLASLLSLLVAMAFPVEGSQQGPMLSSLKKFHYYIFPPLFAAALLHSTDEPERHPFWRVWAAFGALMGVVATAQFFGRQLFPEEWLTNNSFFRVNGETGHFHGQGLMFFHLSFASSMCFVTASALARLIFPLRDDDTRRRAFWAATAVLAGAGVWFSYSRIAFAALGVVLLCLGFLKRPLYGFAAALFVAIAGAGAWNLIPSFYSRFERGMRGIDERRAMWQSAMAMFHDHPLTGVGFSRTGELSPWYVRKLGLPTQFTSHAHNNVLDMLAATGAIGFAAWLAWWAVLFWAAWRAFRLAPEHRRWLPAATLTGFVAFHVNGLTQVNYWDGKSEHALMLWTGVAVALWIRDRAREQAA